MGTKGRMGITNGINLIEILQHNQDSTRTISNDVYEVLHTLGIEAARDIILSEIREVINGAGSYVNWSILIFCVYYDSQGFSYVN